MIVNVLLTLLWLSGAVYIFATLRAARAKGQLSLNLESIGLGAVTNFFDTLGIGSFAPTTAYPQDGDRQLYPEHTQRRALYSDDCRGVGLHQARQRRPHSADSLYRGRHHRRGLRIRRRYSPAHPDPARRGRRGSCHRVRPLCATKSQPHARGQKRVIAGAIMDRHRGVCARHTWRAHDVWHRPLCTITHHAEMMGLDPKAAFPIMMGACAFLMPVGGIRFMNTDRIDMQVVLGIALGGIPAVLIAAYAVTSSSIPWN